MKASSLVLGIAALTLTLTIGAASAAPAGITAANGVLVDANGMTLYIFDKDTAGVSNCYDQCAANWPPVFAESGDAAEGDYTIIDRKDGTKQIAYKGMPLYLWVKDSKPGDMTGDGVNSVWHVIKE